MWPEGSARPVLRRPSDLAREGGGTGPRRRDPGSGAWPRWPAGFAASPGDRSALLVLLSLASLTARRLMELASTRDTASGCLAAVRDGRAGSAADRRFASSIEPSDVRRALDAAGARLVAVHDPEYPPALLDLFDPPAGLFVSGPALDRAEPRVAVVGARACSPSGREAATLIGTALAGSGVCVVSGGARGIDEAAHRGALGAGGRSAAVLGCGIDVPYPRGNARLFDRLRDAGNLVSEYPPGTMAEPFRFPARNRIVAALASAVVVVEGAEGSGSMITAEHALEIGREVFAVPGPISSPLSFVPHTLIREGAALIRGTGDLLEDLGLAPAAPSPGGPSLDPREVVLWEALTTPATADTLAAAAALPVPEVIGILVRLEMRGLVRQAGGRYERRLRR